MVKFESSKSYGNIILHFLNIYFDNLLDWKQLKTLYSLTYAILSRTLNTFFNESRWTE